MKWQALLIISLFYFIFSSTEFFKRKKRTFCVCFWGECRSYAFINPEKFPCLNAHSIMQGFVGNFSGIYPNFSLLSRSFRASAGRSVYVLPYYYLGSCNLLLYASARNKHFICKKWTKRLPALVIIIFHGINNAGWVNARCLPFACKLLLQFIAWWEKWNLYNAAMQRAMRRKRESLVVLERRKKETKWNNGKAFSAYRKPREERKLLKFFLKEIGKDNRILSTTLWTTSFSTKFIFSFFSVRFPFDENSKSHKLTETKWQQENEGNEPLQEYSKK